MRRRLARLWCALTKHPAYVRASGDYATKEAAESAYECSRCHLPYRPPPVPRRR